MKYPLILLTLIAFFSVKSQTLNSDQLKVSKFKKLKKTERKLKRQKIGSDNFVFYTVLHDITVLDYDILTNSVDSNKKLIAEKALTFEKLYEKEIKKEDYVIIKFHQFKFDIPNATMAFIKKNEQVVEEEGLEDNFVSLREDHINKSNCCSGLYACLLYTSPSPRDRQKSRMPSSA